MTLPGFFLTRRKPWPYTSSIETQNNKLGGKSQCMPNAYKNSYTIIIYFLHVGCGRDIYNI